MSKIIILFLLFDMFLIDVMLYIDVQINKCRINIKYHYCFSFNW